jgi:predicted RNA-binding Zn ribbon-like protein
MSPGGRQLTVFGDYCRLRVDRQDTAGDDDARTHPFLFLGGDIALDFVNTVMVEERELVDRITTPAELAAWVAASSLGSEFGAPTWISPSVHARALGLRRALKAGFDALVTDGAVPDSTVATVNAILRTGPGAELRRAADGELRRELRVDLHEGAVLLPWLLADAGARLLVGDRAKLLRRCANHDTCVLVFLDTSRSRTRRWCSMELCGNRSKVAAHARRRRADEG